MKVLDELIRYAQGRFQNPDTGRIIGLFKTLRIDNVVSNIRPKTAQYGELGDFMTARNKIAHGEHTNVSDQNVLKYAELVQKFAQGLVFEVGKVILAVNQQNKTNNG